MFVLVLFFLLVPFDSPAKEPVEYLVDLHLFPLGRLEVSLAGWVRVQRHRIVVIQLVRIVCRSYSLGCHLPAPNPVDYLQLGIGQLDVLHVQLVTNGPPPVLVLWLTDELLNFVHALLLPYFLKLVVVTEMFELVIPAIWHLPDLYLHLFVLLVKRFIIAHLNII